MANKLSDVSLFLDFEDKSASAPTLQFQDFSEGNFLSEAPPPYEKTHNFTNFPASHVDDDDSNKTTTPAAEASGSGPSVWTFSYYQRFFDIDTSEVKERVMWATIPRPSQDFLRTVIKEKPDMYGPFWICVTLIFCIAIMGNISDYIQAGGEGSHWKYDFRKVSISATTIFCYAALLPLFLWIFIWWRRKLGEQIELSFPEIVCLYGYSLAVYIPVSVLWTIPFVWLQWSLVIIAAALSGSVLLISLWKPLSSSKKSIALILVAVILVAHLCLAAGLQLYFFRYSNTEASLHVAATTPLAPLKMEATLQNAAQQQVAEKKPESESKVKRDETDPVNVLPTTVKEKAIKNSEIQQKDIPKKTDHEQVDTTQN